MSNKNNSPSQKAAWKKAQQLGPNSSRFIRRCDPSLPFGFPRREFDSTGRRTK